MTSLPYLSGTVVLDDDDGPRYEFRANSAHQAKAERPVRLGGAGAQVNEGSQNYLRAAAWSYLFMTGILVIPWAEFDRRCIFVLPVGWNDAGDPEVDLDPAELDGEFAAHPTNPAPAG